MSKYVIIGAGAAGISAAEAIRNTDSRGEIILLCEETAGYYSRPGLAYYLTGEIDENFLFPFQAKDFQRLGLRLLHAQARRILPGEHRVVLHDGSQLTYDRLLIATGASAIRADVPGAVLQGVVKLDTLEDARHILKRVRKARTAVVVGGGITALELVEGLRARKLRVHYFLRGERYWANVLDEAESRLVEQRLREEGIQLHYRTELAEILGKRGQVTGVRTADGRNIACDMVAIAIGVRPRKELAEEAGLKVERGVWVDETLRTSNPDIYAAGDVAQFYETHSGKSFLDCLWNTAREQGGVAGSNMTGQNCIYKRGVSFNVTRLAGLTTTIIGAVGGRDADEDVLGIVRGDSETWRTLPDAIAAQAEFDVNRLRILVGERYLLGGVVMGDQTLSRPLQHLVAAKADISSIRSALLQPNTPIADLLAEFWVSWRKEYAAKQP